MTGTRKHYPSKNKLQLLIRRMVYFTNNSSDNYKHMRLITRVYGTSLIIIIPTIYIIAMARLMYINSCTDMVLLCKFQAIQLGQWILFEPDTLLYVHMHEILGQQMRNYQEYHLFYLPVYNMQEVKIDTLHT